MSSSVFQRRTDALQAVRAVVTWGVICVWLWVAVVWLLWANP